MLLENAAYEVRPSGKGISVAGQELTSPIKLLPGEGQERVRLGKHLYKGDIVIMTTAEGKLDIIEYLPLEEYLYGVLPFEMSPSWPLEALKAQAIASRTYALKHINLARNYDVSNGVEKQVYNGSSAINKRVTEAVDSTRGMVLRYRGKLVTAFFHACCGGHTASAKAAWGDDVSKPLYGITDPYCKPSSHYRWSLFISSSELLKMVQAMGSTTLQVRNIKISSKDKSGRALKFRIYTTKGYTTVQAGDMRKRFGTSDFKSTYITSIRSVNDGFRFSGRGWGHGVGMCQDGAKYMALKGMSYKRILHHYYPGAAITDYD